MIRERKYFNQMVESWDVSTRVKHAFKTTDRRAFMPSYVPEFHQLSIYDNWIIPLADGSSMSQPSLVASMTDYLQVEPGMNVLELGTASGYQAALLAHIVGSGGQVHTIEFNPELAQGAQLKLEQQGYKNIAVHTGDGMLGDAEHGPFDRIIATAGARSIPQRWRDQLAPHGIIVAPIGFDSLRMDLVQATDYDGQGNLMVQDKETVSFYPFQSEEEGGFSRAYRIKLMRAKYAYITEIAAQQGLTPMAYISKYAEGQRISWADFVARTAIEEDRFEELSTKIAFRRLN